MSIICYQGCVKDATCKDSTVSKKIAKTVSKKICSRSYKVILTNYFCSSKQLYYICNFLLNPSCFVCIIYAISMVYT